MRRMPKSLERSLTMAHLKVDFGTGRGQGASWIQRSRARVGRRNYEEVLAQEGVEGDEALNSAEAFEARNRIKHEGFVKDVLKLWWHAAIAAARQHRPQATELVFDDYQLIYQALFAQLVDADEYDEAEIYECAAEEYQSDSCSNGSMNEAQFTSGMFELADLHVPSLDAHDYAAFLNNLLVNVMQDAAKGSNGLLPTIVDTPPSLARDLTGMGILDATWNSSGGGPSGSRNNFSSRVGECDAGEPGAGRAPRKLPGLAGTTAEQGAGVRATGCTSKQGGENTSTTYVSRETHEWERDLNAYRAHLMPGTASGPSPQEGLGAEQAKDGRRRLLALDSDPTTPTKQRTAHELTDGHSVEQGDIRSRGIFGSPASTGRSSKGLHDHLDRLLGEGRMRQDCVGCKGNGAQCHECYEEEIRFRSSLTIPRQPREREREVRHREGSVSDVPPWARRKAAGLQQPPPLFPPTPSSPSLPLPPSLYPASSADLDDGGLHERVVGEAPSDCEQFVETIAPPRQASTLAPHAQAPAESTSGSSMRMAQLPLPATPPSGRVLPAPPAPALTKLTEPPVKIQNTPAEKLLAHLLAAVPPAAPSIVSTSGQASPVIMPNTRMIEPGRQGYHRMYSWQPDPRGALSEVILRPSQSLPPCGLSCGYSNAVGVEKYRRVLSSAQALPAFVAANHHHRSTLRNVLSCYDGIHNQKKGMRHWPLQKEGKHGKARSNVRLPALDRCPGTLPSTAGP